MKNKNIKLDHSNKLRLECTSCIIHFTADKIKLCFFELNNPLQLLLDFKSTNYFVQNDQQ